MGKRNIKENTAVITGAASGIGRGIALALAKEQCTMLLADINEARLKQTCEMVNKLGGKGEIFLCDVSKLDDVMRMADHCFNSWGKVDILINNAGALFTTRRLTEDGLEYTLALNHMSYFVMTEGLRERLSASGSARIINTASAAHQGATLDFDDLQSAKSFGATKAYGRSKLCNILFTRELARRLHGEVHEVAVP